MIDLELMNRFAAKMTWKRKMAGAGSYVDGRGLPVARNVDGRWVIRPEVCWTLEDDFDVSLARSEHDETIVRAIGPSQVGAWRVTAEGNSRSEALLRCILKMWDKPGNAAKVAETGADEENE